MRRRDDHWCTTGSKSAQYSEWVWAGPRLETLREVNSLHMCSLLLPMPLCSQLAHYLACSDNISAMWWFIWTFYFYCCVRDWNQSVFCGDPAGEVRFMWLDGENATIFARFLSVDNSEGLEGAFCDNVRTQRQTMDAWQVLTQSP